MGAPFSPSAEAVVSVEFGPCTAYGCDCEELGRAPGRIAGWVHCICGHTDITHRRRSGIARKIRRGGL